MTSIFICLFANLVSLCSFTSLENWSIWLPNNDNSSSYLKTVYSQIPDNQSAGAHACTLWMLDKTQSKVMSQYYPSIGYPSISYPSITYWLHAHCQNKAYLLQRMRLSRCFLFGGSTYDWGTTSRIRPALQDRVTVSTTTPYQSLSVKTVLVKVSSALARRWTHKPYILTFYAWMAFLVANESCAF